MDFHSNDRIVVRPSYLYDENSYTGKTTSLYWDGPQSKKIPSLLHNGEIVHYVGAVHTRNLTSFILVVWRETLYATYLHWVISRNKL